MMDLVAGLLSLCATPIGNVRDASPRLVDVLISADVVAAEDSRRAVRLFRELGITVPGRLVSFYDAVERERLPELLRELDRGGSVALITDAGMPSVSDPGYRLVVAAVAQGATVTVVPGPSAVPAALAVSGLPVERFTFEGFLPRTGGARRRALAALSREPRTMVFFEAPHRVRESLADMVAAFGGVRPAALCRELTKVHEEVVRGTLDDLVSWAHGDVLGEVTIVVQGTQAAPVSEPAEWVAYAAALIDDGASTRDAVTQTAADFDVPRRSVYEAVTGSRGTSPA